MPGIGVNGVGKPQSTARNTVSWLTRGEAATITAVVLSCRLRQTGEEAVNNVGASPSVLECVVERGGTLEPPLDARAVVPKFARHLPEQCDPKKCETSGPQR